MKLKVGDYVEVLEGVNSAGVKSGEQGIVIVDRCEGHESTDPDANNKQLELMFPARSDIWGNDEQKYSGAYGWVCTPKKLKLLYRPRFKR